MTKTVSCRLSVEMHGKLLDKCNDKGMTVNDFVKVLVESTLVESKNASFEANQSIERTSKVSETEQHDDPIGRSSLESQICGLNKLIYKILDNISERIHKFFTWQDVVKCKDCGKVIGVYGVGYGTEEEIKELEEELRFKHIH